jgi:regulator of replication initiation timing
MSEGYFKKTKNVDRKKTMRQAAINTLIARIAERVPRELHSDARFKTLTNLIPRLTGGLVELEKTQEEEGDVASNADKLNLENEELTKLIEESASEVEANFQRAAREATNMLPGPFSSEIRNRFSQLPANEKAVTVQNFIQTNDGPSLAAVLDAPAFVTGLSNEHKKQFSDQFFKTKIPDMWEIRTHYGDLKEHIQSILQINRDIVDVIYREEMYKNHGS